MDHEHREDIRQQLLPYALGELDPRARADVEAVLDRDADLRRELEEIECVGARIIESVPLVTAPADLKGKVLTAIRGGSERPVTQPVTSISAARSERRRRLTPALVSAATLAAACIVLAIIAIDLSGDLDAQRSRAQLLEQRTEQGSDLPRGFEKARSHMVSTSGPLDGAHGSLVRLSQDQWILLLRNTPSPGFGKSWQVWTVNSNGLVENVAQWVGGGSTRVIALDRADVRQVMVSLEPTTRPVPVPSSAPVADVQV